MSFVGRNIKKIRTVKKLSQAAFAELFNLARPSVGAYEEGRAEPKIDTILQIANHFGISVDALLTKEMTINDLYKFDVHAKEIENHMRLERADMNLERQLAGLRSVLVTREHRYEYLIRGNHRDFLASLPKILIPGFDQGDIRAFEVHSDEMHDNYSGLQPGDLAVGKENKSNTFREQLPYVIVTEKEMHFRRFKEQQNQLVFKADNPNMGDLRLPGDAIKESWLIVGYFSREINPPTLLSDRIIALENVMETITRRLERLEKGRK